MSAYSAAQPMYQCRLCLKFNQFCFSLIQENVTDIIEILTNIKISEEDKLSIMCCKSCFEEIRQIYKIRERIIECDEILRSNYEEYNVIKIEDSTNNTYFNEELFDTEYSKSVPSLKTQNCVVKDQYNKLNIIQIEENKELETTNFENDQKINVTRDDKIDKSKTIETQHSKDHAQFSLPVDSGVYKCYECDKEINGRPNLFKHLSKHDLSKCKICSAKLNIRSISDYLRHMKIHSDGPQICELCGVAAKNVESLRGHMFYIHRSSPQQYKCEECKLFFRYKYKYRLHIQKQHVGKKTHVCEFCGKGFFTFSSLQKHINMTHMRLRPHKCQYCLKGFSSTYALRTHIRQHTNETPYVCEICGVGFRQKVSLTAHLRSKHGIERNTRTTQITCS